MTGGRVFRVDDPNDLPDIAAKIGEELRNQYVLGYHPSNKARDARWRKIKIKLRTPKGLVLSASPQKRATTRPAVRSDNAPVALLFRQPSRSRISNSINVERVGNLCQVRESHSVDGTVCKSVRSRIEIATKASSVKPAARFAISEVGRVS